MGMGMGMELQLSLSLPSLKGYDDGGEVNKNKARKEMMNNVKNKRSFSQAFHLDASSNMLSWNGHPNDDEDPTPLNRNTCHTTPPNKIEEEENEVVGWPPIKSWRKKLFSGQLAGRTMVTNDQTAEREGSGSKSMHVKVRMEGVAIGRKVDLRLYQSYGTLRNALISMFSKYQKSDKSEVRYTLTYQDREGDWLLAGDVPWETFIECVQRMEILRNAG